MNRSKGNMYQFNDELYTYNAIKGSCSHDCSYCYMKRIRSRFGHNPTLRLDSKELNQNLGLGRFVFVGSSTDDFASDVPVEWIEAILDHIYLYSGNYYMLQSKNPKRFLEFTCHKLYKDRKDKLIFCTTIESDVEHNGISKAPAIKDRVDAMKKISALGFKTMVTVEPIMKFSGTKTFADILISMNPLQVNIGANTTRGINLLEPTGNEIRNLISELETRGMSVHMKSNLDRLLI